MGTLLKAPTNTTTDNASCLLRVALRHQRREKDAAQELAESDKQLEDLVEKLSENVALRNTYYY